MTSSSTLPIDRGLLGLTLGLAVALNPFVLSLAQAKTLAVTGGGLAASSGPVHLSARLDRGSVLVGQDGEVRAELVLSADHEVTKSERKDTDLVVILDRSGSMRGEKISFAKAAVRELVGQLGPDDRFALVTYSDDASARIALGYATDDARRQWLASVDSVRADGYTNMSGGMDLAFDLIEGSRAAGRAARAVLISDGLPNQGDPSPEGLVRRASRAPRGDYVMTAVGVGSDFNEHLMTRLADAGTGNYHYLASGHDLAAVFANELSTARTTVASSVAVTIDPASGVAVTDASGYPLEVDSGGSVVFRPGILFSGQERRVWVTFRVRPDAVGELTLGSVSMSWKRDGRAHSLALGATPVVQVVEDERRYYTDIDKETWERSVVTEEWNETRQKASKAVAAGRKDEAISIVRDYRNKNAAANAEVGSAAVTSNLDEAAAFEDEIEESFSGADQAEKQNTLSKGVSSEAYKARRVGQVKQ